MEENVILNRESVTLKKDELVEVDLKGRIINLVENCIYTVEHNSIERLDIQFVFSNKEGQTITYPIHNLQNHVPFTMSIETLENIEFLNVLKVGANINANIVLTIQGNNGSFI